MSTRFAELAWPACTSALRLDRFLMGELGQTDAEEIRTHLEGCVRCAKAADALRAEREQTRLPPLRSLPPAELAPRASPGRWRMRAVAAGMGLAAAASVLLILRPAGIGERPKGSNLALAMYVQHGEEVRRAGPGEVVAPGDALRFAVTTPQSAYVAVLSVDPKGRASIYYPLGGRAERVAAGHEVPLALSTRLDATVGEERVVGLFCSSPVELEPVRAALQAGSAQVPQSCQVIRWSFVKR